MSPAAEEQGLSVVTWKKCLSRGHLRHSALFPWVEENWAKSQAWGCTTQNLESGVGKIRSHHHIKKTGKGTSESAQAQALGMQVVTMRGCYQD